MNTQEETDILFLQSGYYRSLQHPDFVGYYKTAPSQHPNTIRKSFISLYLCKSN